MKNQYVDDYCMITCVDNNNQVRADILSFNENKFLSVALNKSVKLNMVYNGRVYEAKSSGLTFVSNGPKITQVKNTRT